MTTEKIAITVPIKILDQARRAIRRDKSSSLSAYISRAIEERVMNDDLDALLEKTGGPLTQKETAWAEQTLRKAARKGSARERVNPRRSIVQTAC